MRLILAICCLTSVAFARPQNGYGYQQPSKNGFNYQQASQQGANFRPTNNNQLGLPQSFGSFGAPSSQFGAAGHFAGHSAQFGHANKFGGHSPQFGAPSSQSSQFESANNYQPNEDDDGSNPEEEPLITKQFYLHSAPEDTFNTNKAKHFKLGRAQKNYRVIFIKAPASNAANVQLSAEYAPQEEKTVIYVLSQKEHEINVNEIATPPPTQPSKPEVFFIKYKTPEEAAHAQQQIQAQYDDLGGQSEVSDEGVAPVSSVEGILGDDREGSGSRPEGVSANYLPPRK